MEILTVNFTHLFKPNQKQLQKMQLYFKVMSWYGYGLCSSVASSAGITFRLAGRIWLVRALHRNRRAAGSIPCEWAYRCRGFNTLTQDLYNWETLAWWSTLHILPLYALWKQVHFVKLHIYLIPNTRSILIMNIELDLINVFPFGADGQVPNVSRDWNPATDAFFARGRSE
jgi:hypothetical protein